ncbi:hypothetical protein GCM10007216_01760 [Thalassobacillus devorans]|uniref:Uncharacterized protein n=1 Tax=Thalassobacillus devorans TaxID=279813 RepID=A0ABQ1NEQ1_9BACI|nr:hypothetical protein GCM10007216_01760 [Thalassobacillus devorans]
MMIPNPTMTKNMIANKIGNAFFISRATFTPFLTNNTTENIITLVIGKINVFFANANQS